MKAVPAPFILSSVFCLLSSLPCIPASAPTFDGEQLHYSINWPSGLSIGEVHLRSSRVKPTPKSTERYDFDVSIDAAVPGFAVADRYHSEASKDFCSQQCAKDALDFLFFVRRELAQGRLAPRQKIYFGSPYDVHVEFAATQMIKVSDNSVEADRLNVSVKGPQSDVNFEAYFLKDAARTLAMVRVPLAVGTFSMELMK